MNNHSILNAYVNELFVFNKNIEIYDVSLVRRLSDNSIII